MEIQFEEKEGRGAFYIEEKTERLAEMVFTRAANGNIIIEHTQVSDRLKGTGAGKRLVAAGVAYARQNHIKIIPLCPFAKAIIAKTPEYADIL